MRDMRQTGFAGRKTVQSAASLIRILTVDDHPLLRKGIAALVNAGYVSIVRPDQLASHGYKHHTSSNTYILNLGLR